MNKYLVWFILIVILRYSNAGCPKATFEFYNNTKKIPYNFIDSSVGNIGSLETCPYTGRPYVYLPCYPNSSWGNEPYYSTCLKPPDHRKEETTSVPVMFNPYFQLSIDQIAKLWINTSNEMSNIISYFNQDSMTFQSSSDVISAIDIIDRMTMINHQDIDDRIQSNFYTMVDKLLASNSMQEAQKSNRSIVKLFSSIDAFSQNLKMNEFEQNFQEKNLAVSIVNMPNNRTKPIIGFAFDSTTNQTSTLNVNDIIFNSTAITLDSQAISQQTRLTFSIYNHQHGLFDDEQYRLLTRVVSLTIDKPELTKDLGAFVKINFYLEHSLQVNHSNITCAYWHIFDNMTAQWSTHGCALIDITERNILCECSHLTHFAVLMDIEQKSIPEVVKQVISILTLAGSLLSSIGLCLTILTFLLFKKLRRHFSQKSLLLLSINLLVVNILFSITSLYTFKNLSCVIVASLLHYFVLSSFSWMFIMAVIQYLLFVKVFPGSISAFTRKAAAFAQLVPLIPVSVILIIDPLIYTKRGDEICWLSGLPLYLSFILPIVLYILLNSILFSIVAHALLCGKTGQQLHSTQIAESQRLSRFLVTLSCFVVLGLTWTFGLVAIGPMRLLFQILFCVFASLTGFLIFILYIVTSKAKRTYWNNAFKTLGISTIYSPSSSALGGTKEFSTTSTNDQQQQRIPSRLVQFPSQPQHFIDAYMPSSPPPPAPPLPLPPHFLIEGDDPLNVTTLGNHFYEPRHLWIPPPSQMNQPTTSLDDYSLFYASNHDATKL